MADLVGSLRSEIVESIKIRADFLKWKMLLIAVLGAAALGLTSNNHGAPELLGFVPLVCAYADILCIHTDLRIFVIAKFLRDGPDAASAHYERFCHQERHTLGLEQFALVGTTIAVSLLVMCVAIWPDRIPKVGGNPFVMTGAARLFLISMALVGFVFSTYATAFKAYKSRTRL